MGVGSSKLVPPLEHISTNKEKQQNQVFRTITNGCSQPDPLLTAISPECPLPASASVHPFPLTIDSPIPIQCFSELPPNQGLTLEEIIGTEGSCSKYIRRKIIGQGAYGEALIVERNPLYNPSDHPRLESQHNPLSRPTTPGSLYVAKVADLREMRGQSRDYALSEFICLGHSHHFAVIKYFEHFVVENANNEMVLITELANHGDLHHNLVCNDLDSLGNPVKPLRLNEREAGIYFFQILCALNHIHRRRMIHRDVKSANLFVTSSGIIKLGDFGFSRKYESTVSSESVAGTFLGTPYYLSPEMWRGMRYGKRADVWAAGVVLYEMLMDGKRPFDADGLGDLREEVLTQEVVLPGCPPPSPDLNRGYFSSEMRDLVHSIFVKNPVERPSAEELLAIPLMVHYLSVLERHLYQLFRADDALIAAQPNVDVRSSLNFPNEGDRALLLEGLQEAKMISINARKDTLVVAEYEGVVYKDSQNGVWKERYLTLRNGVLTISLAKGKTTTSGSDKCKAVPLESILSTTPCSIARPPGTDPKKFIPPFGFAISMKSMHAIVFGLLTEGERDEWLTAIMKALEMD